MKRGGFFLSLVWVWFFFCFGGCLSKFSIPLCVAVWRSIGVSRFALCLSSKSWKDWSGPGRVCVFLRPQGRTGDFAAQKRARFTWPKLHARAQSRIEQRQQFYGRAGFDEHVEPLFWKSLFTNNMATHTRINHVLLEPAIPGQLENFSHQVVRIAPTNDQWEFRVKTRQFKAEPLTVRKWLWAFKITGVFQSVIDANYS